MIEIRPVHSKKELRDFVRVPMNVQGDDPHFIPRLNFEMMQHLCEKNPYFKHAQHQFFTAYQNETPVGRISAHIDTLAQKDGQAIVGHFGLLEAMDSKILQTLIDAAEGWLVAHGAKSAEGPYSLSINDEMGLLVSGFDTPARIMMNHAPQWYAQAVEDAGYEKIKDVLAYDMDVKTPLPKSVERIALQTKRVAGLSERAIDMKNFRADLRMIMDIFNDAWAENWGFIPMTQDEINYAADNMKIIINPALARIVFIHGKPTAMIVGLPDINEAVAGMKGRLFPFNWLKLIWRLRIKGLKKMRVLLMGVSKEYHGHTLSSGLSGLLIKHIQEAAKAHGYERAEMSWILEDNHSMNRLIMAAGGAPYKRYRIFRKTLA